MKTSKNSFPSFCIWLISLFLVLSTNSYGQMWDIIYQPGDDMGRDVIVTSDYCYFATSTNSPFDPGKSMKINQRGYRVWETPYGGMAVQQTFDNGYVLAGCASYTDARLQKLDENGNLLWSKLYGGWQQDEFSTLIQSSDSCLVAAGFTMSHADSTIYVVKTDQAGNMIWERCFKGLDFSTAHKIIEFGGYYYLIGSTEDADLIQYLYVAKLSLSGILQWSKTYKGWYVNSSGAIAYDSTLIITGDNKLLKLSLEGDSLWSKDVPSGLDICCIAMAPDNGYILGGSKVFGSTLFTSALVKTDPDGNIEWTKIYRGANNDYWGRFEAVQSANQNGYTACGYNVFENSTTKWRIIKTDSYGDCLVGIDPGIKMEASVFYPNPTNGKITTDKQNLLRLDLLTITGLPLMSCNHCSQLNLSPLPQGIYILKILSPQGISFEKIIKQ
jgi:hypothetical protein